MSVMNSIFGKLGLQTPAPAAAPNAAPAQQQQVLPGNIPAQANNPAAANNPMVPAAGVAATGTENNPAPEGLDKFADIWNIPDDQKPKAPEAAFEGVTPEALQQIAGKTDFSKVVTAEMMQSISKGGEEGVAAMMAALNATSQQVYAQSAGASINLINTALAKQREQFEAALPNLIKSQNVTESLRTANPVFNNPASAPMLNMLQRQLQEKYPTASAAEIQSKAQDYLLNFATAITPQKQATQQETAKTKSTDFSDW